jgi:EmrB/QacA subfamily drug resistance transporter
MNRPSLTRKQIALVMAGTMMTLLLAALDNTIVSTAMPKIIRDLNGMEHYAWPFTAYMLFSTIILPVSGKLADIYGRRKITLLGIAVFTLTSMWCGFSRSMIELSVLRGFQGIGGGICISSAFIIVSEIFPMGQRAKYIGLITSMFAVASILGPGAGGLITDYLSWRWVFFVNIPLSIVAFTLIAKNLPILIHHDEKRKMDVIGVIVFVLAAFPLLLVISQVGSRSLLSFELPALALFSAGMFALFLHIEKRSQEPLLSLHFFREKIFSVSVLASSLGNMAIFGAAIYFPLYLQSVRGESATRSGFIIMPMMVSLILASNLSGLLVSRFHRYKPLAATGFLLSCGGMFCFGFWGERSTIPILIAFSSLSGIGLGLTFPIFMVAAQSIFAPQQIGVVTSLMQFFRSLGGSIGSAFFGAIMISRMNSGLTGLSFGTLPMNIAELIKNPLMIANPQKMATIRGGLSPSVLADFDRFVSLCLHSIAGSIETIFLVSSGILFAALWLVIVDFNEGQVIRAITEHKRKRK